jgi:hypothetical protein
MPYKKSKYDISNSTAPQAAVEVSSRDKTITIEKSGAPGSKLKYSNLMLTIT